MGQPSSVNKFTRLDNILLWVELTHPQRYGTTFKVLKDLLSLLHSIRGQTARCVRARHQARRAMAAVVGTLGWVAQVMDNKSNWGNPQLITDQRDHYL